MRINESEVIVACDVDGTLIRPVNKNLYSATGHRHEGLIAIKNPYDNQEYVYEVHTEHLELLRQYKGRGFYIRVWSAGGVQHAASVVRALGLEDDGTVDEVETKPMKHIDDKKNSIHITGARVFIPRPGWSEET